MKSVLFLLIFGSSVLTPVEPTGCFFKRCEQICRGLIIAECSCYAGYTISRYDKTKCDDINECALSNPCGSGRCENTPGSYRCSCGGGYTTSSSGYCIDIDECRSSPCQHKCTNTDGSFRCSCNSGFAPSKTDPTRCVAVNNCQQGTRPSISNPSNCVDIDECAEENPCQQLCSNSQGSYECGCRPGYILSDKDFRTCIPFGNCQKGFKQSSSDPSKCVDIDECAETKPCQQLCVNSQGSYECGCEPGFTLCDDDFTTCLPNDPCASNPCQHSCSKTDTGFKCSCRRGYAISEADPTKCEDIDECTVDKPCHQVCQNTPGSYQCSCNEGYTPSPEDPSFCVGGIATCKADSCEHICTNTSTGIKCSCKKGFKVNKTDPTKCDDIDECAVSNQCHQKCTNTKGSFKCSCNEGYAPSTEDRNFCVELPREKCSANTCEHNCTDTSTGYKCSCLPGYNVSKSDPKKCEDINECDTKPCQQICKNTVGSYVCSCRDSYVVVPENPSRCEKIDMCQTKADILIVFDASQSIGEAHYAKQFDFCKKFIKNFALGPNDVRFGALLFSRTVEVLFTLDSYNNYSSIDKALTNVPYLKSVTLTELAFQLIDKDALFSPEKGGRNDAPDFVVLFTDGDPTNLPETLAAATTLKNKGVHVFCVGIGNAVKEEILNQIATSSSDTFLATDFDRLPQIEKELTTVICNAVKTQ